MQGFSLLSRMLARWSDYSSATEGSLCLASFNSTMETKEPIKLRAHHLRTLGNFLFKLTDFKITIKEVLEEILENKEQKILLIKSAPDKICELCDNPHKELDICFDDPLMYNDSPTYLHDAKVAEAMGLEIGETYTVREIVEILQQNEPTLREWYELQQDYN